MGSRPLPEGWDLPIPDATWPETLVSAVRHNVDALLSPRAMASLKGWQEDSLSEDPVVADRGKRWLRALGAALIPNPAPETDESVFDAESQPTAFYLPNAKREPSNEEFASGTVDAFHLPPVPTNLRARDEETSEEGTVDSARVDQLVEAKVTGAPIAASGASRPNSSDFEDERPTTAFEIPDDAIPPPPPLPPPIPVDDDSGTHAPLAMAGAPLIQDDPDGGPTRHIAVPDRVLLARLDSAEEALLQAEPERTHIAAVPLVPDANPANLSPEVVRRDLDLESRPSSKIESSLMSSDPEPRSGPRRVAPKPGVIRRHSRVPAPAPARSEARPRAAMHHVRSLYSVLTPFMEELVPLSYERRSRRFWARWREVAGDRGGVRRSFVEDLLQSAQDARTLACELISEIQTVDLESVYVLVDRLVEEDEAPRGAGAPERQRGQAAVEVRGVKEET